jgi:L-arabinokinase
VYIPQSTRDLIARMKADSSCVISRDPAAHGREVVLARAPGRLDVMGGIADYTGSLVCQMPLDLSTAVGVQRRDDRTVVIESYNVGSGNGGGGQRSRVEISLDDLYGTAALLPVETVRGYFTAEKHWAAYVAGAYWVLAKHRKLTRRASGANIVCHSNVPLGAGVGSSAALEVAALSAITTAYHLILDPLETAALAQAIENLIVGAPSGIMDQVASMMGRKGKLLLLECRPHEIKSFVDVPAGLMLCGIDSGVRHSIMNPAYRATRVAAFMAHAIILRAYHDLGFKNDPMGGYLANLSATNYWKYLRKLLPKSISGAEFTRVYGTTADKVTKVEPNVEYHVLAAADHHVMENARVQEFVDMLEQSASGSEDALFRAGRLMVASHHSYGCRANLGSKETDQLAKSVMKLGPKNGFYGAKITGGGSGGTVAVLCDDNEKSRAALGEIIERYKQQTKLPASLLTGSSEGAAETGPLRMTTAELFA